ncbi:MAG: peptidoglycan DD-metalloendopeptidase family protein [Bacilli bacterium]|nr:peptidoglycan DD-metalloendopeptidase family protein [Bacilli bacterium]
MGKKVDLNKPINNGNTKNNNHANHHINNFTQNSSSNTVEKKNSSNVIKKTAAEAAMRSIGVPKETAKKIANDEKLLDQATGKGIIKMPFPLRLFLPILAFIPLIFLMFFVVLAYDEDDSGNGIGGSFAYGKTCTTVTVTDSGCDSNAKNCTNKYDGEVELEEYVAGVVAAEVGGANNLEYYKVAAITARTYFLSHTSDSCTIEGNTTAQSYKDVDDSSNAALIRQAVEETKGLVLIKNEKLSKTNYASACVVNADENYYYVRYGTSSLGKANFQKIPKEWDSDSSHAYSGYLKSWYSKVDQNDTDYENKKCPSNHDYGMSQLGALYLITGENYSYDEVLEYYYGAEIKKNEMQHIGAEGFINPTRRLRCTSAYGYRIHPKKQIRKFHSGLDIGISGGEPIYAAKDGTITYVRKNITAINDCDYGYGNYITIDHGDGTSTRYAHIKYGTIPDSIVVGANVSQGEQIGQVGSTGCSTGNHLHYEVMVNGSNVDPADYLDLTGASGTCKR